MISKGSRYFESNDNILMTVSANFYKRRNVKLIGKTIFEFSYKKNSSRNEFIKYCKINLLIFL